MIAILAATPAEEANDLIQTGINTFAAVAAFAIAITAFFVIRSIIEGGIYGAVYEDTTDEDFEDAMDNDEVDSYAEEDPWDPWSDEEMSTGSDFEIDEGDSIWEEREASRY